MIDDARRFLLDVRALIESSRAHRGESLEIAPADYEAVRRKGARFLVVPGHQLEGIERVVDGNGRFLVVEKVGIAVAIAEAENPRAA